MVLNIKRNVAQNIKQHLVAGLFLLSDCGPNSKVSIRHIDLRTSEVGGETFLNLDAQVKIGNVKLPKIEVPVINPKDGKNYGQMKLQPLANHTNQLLLAINYKAITDLDPTSGKVLPNGREHTSQLGLGNDVLVGIPILQNSKVYVGGDLRKNLYLGVALGIPGLDQTMSNIPFSLNLFFRYVFSAEILGVGGLYTSPFAGQNGIAIFAKKSPKGIDLVSNSLLEDLSEKEPNEQNILSVRDRFKLFQALNQLLQQKATLRIH